MFDFSGPRQKGSFPGHRGHRKRTMRSCQLIRPGCWCGLVVGMACLTFPLQAQTTATWKGGTGNWTDSTQWTFGPGTGNTYPDNGQSGNPWTAKISAGSADLQNNTITINTLNMSGGTIAASGTGSLKIVGAGSTWSGGTLG